MTSFGDFLKGFLLGLVAGGVLVYLAMNMGYI